MLPRNLEAFSEQALEIQESFAFHPSQYLEILERELEWRSFQPDVTRRVAEHEPKVDVNDVPVNENVEYTAMREKTELLTLRDQ